MSVHVTRDGAWIVQQWMPKLGEWTSCHIWCGFEDEATALASIAHRRAGNFRVVNRFDGPRQRPGPVCSNDACACAHPGPPCDEWMGDATDEWCPCCGWNRAGHPKADTDG